MPQQQPAHYPGKDTIKVEPQVEVIRNENGRYVVAIRDDKHTINIETKEIVDLIGELTLSMAQANTANVLQRLRDELHLPTAIKIA